MGKTYLAVTLLFATALLAADSKTNPTFLKRFVPEAPAKAVDLTSPSARYKPVFGEGDSQPRVARALSRYGELTVDAGGASAAVEYPREEHVHVVLQGAGTLVYGEQKQAIRKHDFYYLPPGTKHALTNSAAEPLRVVVMGFRIPTSTEITRPEKLLIANMDDVPLQVVGSHPPSTKYRLLMGDRKSTRDRIAAGHVLTSLFIMEFEPAGTNIPHHHPTEEEAYLLLDGTGDMVAGGGMDGVEGLHPSKPGDAFLFRLNCTVGFYNRGAGTARILAVRWLYPFGR